MATQLSKPVTREISAHQISDALGISANRALVVTMGLHGITIKAKGRKLGETLIPWENIIRASGPMMGITQLTKDLR